jgi:hypothetical protein
MFREKSPRPSDLARSWQCKPLGAMAAGMKRPFIPIILVAIAAPAFAQGAIGVAERGAYVCELPGDAGSLAGVVQPSLALTIESASRYSSPQGAGTYLRRGDTVVLTSGPRQGESYAVVSASFLRRIEDGKPGRLRCVRSGR